MDTTAIAVIVLLGLVALRWVIIGVGVALLLRPVRACPACFAETLGLHHRLLRYIRWLEWRWCPRCGWHGPARRVDQPAAAVSHRSSVARPEQRRSKPRG